MYGNNLFRSLDWRGVAPGRVVFVLLCMYVEG